MSICGACSLPNEIYLFFRSRACIWSHALRVSNVLLMNDYNDGECICAREFGSIKAGRSWCVDIDYFCLFQCKYILRTLATKYPILSKNIKTELYSKLLVINLRYAFIRRRHRWPSSWHGCRMRNADPINRQMQLHSLTPSDGGAAMKFSFLLQFFFFALLLFFLRFPLTQTQLL